jgi:hypothetical protein
MALGYQCWGMQPIRARNAATKDAHYLELDVKHATGTGAPEAYPEKSADGYGGSDCLYEGVRREDRE